MTSRLILSSALALTLAASPATAQPAAVPAPATTVASLLERLAGRWTGTGVVTGLPSRVDMHWQSALQDAFTHLTFRNAMTAADGTSRVFEARGYYRRQASAAATGTWIDSRGLILPLVTSATGEALTSDWGGAGTEQGRTTYRLVDERTLEVVDAVRTRDGTLREFGRTTLTRIP